MNKKILNLLKNIDFLSLKPRNIHQQTFYTTHLLNTRHLRTSSRTSIPQAATAKR